MKITKLAYVAWLALMLCVLFTGSAFGQWGAAQLLNDPSESSVKTVKLAAAKTGGFHAVYSNTNPWQIVYRRYQNGYLTPRKVVRTGYVPNATICEAGNGDIHLAWEDWDDTLEIGWSKSTDGGKNFSTYYEITNTSDTKHPHLCAYGPDNSPNVMMSYWEAAEQDLYWRTFDGSGWGPLTNMYQYADNEYEVFGMCRSLQDGTVYRSYGNRIGGVLSVCYRRFNGSYWEPQVVVESPGFFARHDIAVNPIGQIMVMWERNEQVWTKIYTPGAGWGPTQGRETPSGFAAITAIPGSNDFYLLYTVDGNKTYGARWSGGGWLPRELVSVGLPDAMSVGGDVVAGPDGAIYAAWEYWGSNNPQQWFNVRPGGPPPDSTLVGVVRDQYGVGVSGAYVGSGGYATVSGAGGSYTLLLPAGTYTLTANKDYYTGQSIPNVVLTSGQTRQLDFVITASPPAAPSPFVAAPSNGIVRLSWVNPTSGNFQGTRILVKTGGYPANPNDGALVCDRNTFPGQYDSYTHTGLSNGTIYYYAAFAHDGSGHYSAPAKQAAQPFAHTCSFARQLADGQLTDLAGKIVTANFASSDGIIYVQEPDRTAAVRVSCGDTTLAVGDVVNVTGTMATRVVSGYAAERYINSATVTKMSSGDAPRPLAMTCSAVGGAPLGLTPGVKGGVGLNNIGMLVTISGRVTHKSGQYVYVDDGSRVENLYGLSTPVVGVMIKCPGSSVPCAVGDIVSVTGIIEGSVPNNVNWTTNRRYMRLRDWNDLVLVSYTPTTGVISGTVKDSSGTGIVGASVTTSPGGYSATTTTSGSYTITSVPPGTYSVTASKTGYTTDVKTAIGVSVDQTTTVNFTISPNIGTITGTVKDASGVAIVGATVITSPKAYSTTTGTGGSFTLSGVDVGTYSVTASKTGYVNSTQAGVTITSGSTAIINLVLNANVGTLTGTVRDTLNNAIAGATVSTGAGGPTATTNSSGIYSMTVTPGSYFVTASKAGYISSTQPATVSFNQTTTLNFSLSVSPVTEKLVNGSFEGGFFNSGWWGGYCANGWGFAWKGNPANNSFYFNSHNAGFPRNTVHLVQGKVDNFEAGIAQEITGLTPGASYTFSADSYKTGGNYSVFIAVRPGTGHNSNMGTISGTAFPGTTGAWVSQSVSGTVDYSGSVTVYLWVKRLSGSTADIYFDNASFMSW